NKVFDACGRMAAGAQRTACEAAAVKPAQDKAFAGEAYAAAKSRLDQINSLMGQINQTQDPKAIAELQGRIASEQAMIANEQTKLQLFQMMAQADEKLHEQRQREINAKQLARRGYLDLQPLTFN
ncbi:type IV secretion system protein, partial [Xanthomonas vasicola]